MSWVAVATIGGALLSSSSASKTNKSNERIAQQQANATPKFNTTLQPEIEKNLGTTSGSPYSAFQGQDVAGFSTQQNQALGNGGAVAQGLNANAGTASEGFNAFASGQFRDAGNPQMQAMVASLQQNAQDNFQRNTNPAIQNTAVQDGGIGGSRQGIAQGLAISDMNKQLINAEADMRGNQYNQDMSNQLSALQNQGSILSGQTAGDNYLMQQGGLVQALQQANLDSGKAKFLDKANGQYNRDKDMLSLLLGTPTSSGQFQAPVRTDPMAAGFGGALTAYQLAQGYGGGNTTPAPVPTWQTGGGMNPNNFEYTGP